MDAEQRLVAVVRDLTGRHPFRREAVSRVVGRELRDDPGHSTEYFTVWSSTDPGHDLWTAVEVREPRDPASKQGGLVILTVNPALCVAQDAIRARFGPQPDLVVPTPRQPPDAPLYLRYQMAWGTLSFGFERAGRKCLRRVVLDGTAG